MSTLVFFCKIEYTFYVLIKKFSLICLTAFFLFSCKIDKNLQYIDENAMSLKTKLNNSLESIEWSEEIEPNILYTSKKDTSKESANTNSLLTEANLFLATTGQSRQVYPYMLDFGSLDTKDLNPQTESMLEDFLQNISNAKIQKNAFSKNARHLSILFVDFLENYPKAESWIFGQSSPLVSKSMNFLEVPVKVFSNKDNKKATYVLIFFILQDEDNPRIQQVQIGKIRYE